MNHVGARFGCLAVVATIAFALPARAQTPPPVVSLKTSQQGRTYVEWGSSPDAASYLLRINDTANDVPSAMDGWYVPGSADVCTGPLSTTTYDYASLQGGHKYGIWVHAVDAQGRISAATWQSVVVAPQYPNPDLQALNWLGVGRDSSYSNYLRVTYSIMSDIYYSGALVRINDPTNDGPAAMDGWYTPGTTDVCTGILVRIPPSHTEYSYYPVEAGRSYSIWVHGVDLRDCKFTAAGPSCKTQRITEPLAVSASF